MESSDVVIFDLGPLLKGQMWIAKHKSAHNSLIEMLFIFKTMLGVLLWSCQRCILGNTLTKEHWTWVQT